MTSKATCAVLVVLSVAVSIIAFVYGMRVHCGEYLVPKMYVTGIILLMISAIVSKNWVLLYKYGCNKNLTYALSIYDFYISLSLFFPFFQIFFRVIFTDNTPLLISAIFQAFVICSVAFTYGKIKDYY